VRFVVAYDVEDDKKRRKIQKFISQWSDEWQKSVYEVDVSRSEIKRIYQFLSEVCEEGDKFLIFPIKEGFSFGKGSRVEFVI
jgi:CRISPR-associated endonuclease Cas2